MLALTAALAFISWLFVRSLSSRSFTSKPFGFKTSLCLIVDHIAVNSTRPTPRMSARRFGSFGSAPMSQENINRSMYAPLSASVKQRVAEI